MTDQDVIRLITKLCELHDKKIMLFDKGNLVREIYRYSSAFCTGPTHPKRLKDREEAEKVYKTVEKL